VIGSGPSFKAMKIEGNKADRFICGYRRRVDGDGRETAKFSGFEIAGRDQVFFIRQRP